MLGMRMPPVPVTVRCTTYEQTRLHEERFISLMTSSSRVKGAPESQHCLNGCVRQYGMGHDVTLYAYVYIGV